LPLGLALRGSRFHGRRAASSCPGRARISEIDEILVCSRRIQNFVDLDVRSPVLTGPFRGAEALTAEVPRALRDVREKHGKMRDVGGSCPRRAAPARAPSQGTPLLPNFAAGSFCAPETCLM